MTSDWTLPFLLHSAEVYLGLSPVALKLSDLINVGGLVSVCHSWKSASIA